MPILRNLLTLYGLVCTERLTVQLALLYHPDVSFSRCLCALLLWLLPLRFEAQPAPPPLTFRTLTTAHGLTDNSIYCMVQDRRGFLWFGSQDGLNRYDGAAVRTFRHDPQNPTSLTLNWVTALALDHDGQLWVATGGAGVCRYNPLTGRFRRFEATGRPGALANGFNRTVFCDRQGRVWVGTEDGLALYEPRSGHFRHFRHAPSSPARERQNAVRAIDQAPDGTLWVGTSEGYLSRLDERAGQLVADPRWRLTSKITALRVDAAGGVWVGTDTDGLLCVPASGGPIRAFRMSEPGRPGPLPSNWIRTLLFDNQQQLWAGTDNGLVRYQPGTGQFSTYQWQPAQPTSLPDNHVRGLYQDRTGLLWAGTDNGVSSFAAQTTSFRVLPLNLPGPVSVFAVSEDQRGQVWVGTEQHGLIRYDPATGQRQWFRHHPAEPGSLGEDFVRAVHPAPDGQLWVGTRSRGLDQLIPGTTRFRHHPLPAERGTAETIITCLTDDAHGGLWVGTEGGLRHFTPGTGRWRSYRHDPADSTSLSNNFVYRVFLDRRQRLWVGTGGGGLCLLEDGAAGRFRTFRADERVPGRLTSPFVRDIAEDRRGRLWVGTEGGGLCQLVDEQRGRFTSIREAQGLPEDVVYGVLEDEQGRLWLSSNKGLARYDPGTGTVHTFDSRDGLGQDEFNAGGFWRGRGGQLYFGGVSGVVAFRAAAVRTNRTPPAVVFTGLRKFDQLVELDTSVTERRLLRIPPRDNSFTLEFAALNFEHPDKNRYQYRLEGFNDNWIAAGTKHEATYTNLAPGRYTLHVRAANNDGVWNQRGAALGIVVEPAWYQMWWFRAVVVAAVAGALYLLYRLRVNQLLALERVRYGIARDLHDDVGSTLSSISVLAEVAHSHYHSPHPERAAALLEQIGESSRRMLDAMGDIVWTINPGHDSLEDVIIRMRSFASDTLEARDIDFTFDVAPGVPDLKLSMGTRRDLFLIYKEALNNLVKYARCQNAAIRLGYGQHRLLLSIQDDGVGFDAAAPAQGGGNGLGNMRARATGMGGELRIDTVLGQGTTLHLSVPLSR